MNGDWQDALWNIVNFTGPAFDLTVATVAAATSLTMFVKLIMHEDWRRSLIIARGTVSLGLAMLALVPLNSGWLKIGLAVVVGGLALSTVLIVLNWCDREDQSSTLLGAAVRALWRLLCRATAWLCGPRLPIGPGDRIALGRDD